MTSRPTANSRSLLDVILLGAGGLALASAAVAATLLWLVVTDPLAVAGLASNHGAGVLGVLQAITRTLIGHVFASF